MKNDYFKKCVIINECEEEVILSKSILLLLLLKITTIFFETCAAHNYLTIVLHFYNGLQTYDMMSCVTISLKILPHSLFHTYPYINHYVILYVQISLFIGRNCQRVLLENNADMDLCCQLFYGLDFVV